MALKRILSPSGSIGVAIGTAGLVYAIYGLNVPNLGIIHATQANDSNVESARKKAAWEAAFAVFAASILTRDLNPWIFGGGAIVVSDWYTRHANATNPETGQVVANPGSYGSQVQNTGQYGTNYGGLSSVS